MKCQAIVRAENHYKQEYHKSCENEGTHFASGACLCLTHLNAYNRGSEVKILVRLEPRKGVK
jgi:hypothetical protein